MIDKLFSSKILFSVLSTLFLDQNKVYSTTEIIKITGKNQVNVLHELEKLVDWRMVKKEKKGNQNYYELNKDYEYFAELKSIFEKYNAENNQKYFLLNEEGNPALLSLYPFAFGYSSKLGVDLGVFPIQQKIISHYKNNYVWFYFEKSAFERGEKESLRKLLADPSFVDTIIYPKIMNKSKEAQQIFNVLFKKNFKVNKVEAVEIVNKIFEIISTQVALNAIATFDLKDYIFTNYLKRYFEKVIVGKAMTISSVLEVLLSPEEKTLTQELRIILINLALKFINGGDYSHDLKKIENEWCWINYGYRGPVMDYSFFEDSLRGLLKHDVESLQKELLDLENWENIIKEKKDKLYQELGVDKKHQRFITALSTLSYLKVYRKDIAFMLIYLLYKILEQFNKDYKKENLFYLTNTEALKLIKGELKISKMELFARQTECLQFGGDDKIITGKKVQEMVDSLVEKDNSLLSENGPQRVKLLEGTTSCLGATGDWVYGEVKVVNTPEEMKKMEEGNIMVSVATTPDIVMAMKKAGAIVTDYGGITSHAAIVSRELNKPCLIGTKYATKLFKDGDKVIVCPRHGYIKFQ